MREGGVDIADLAADGNVGRGVRRRRDRHRHDVRRHRADLGIVRRQVRVSLWGRAGPLAEELFGTREVPEGSSAGSVAVRLLGFKRVTLLERRRAAGRHRRRERVDPAVHAPAQGRQAPLHRRRAPQRDVGGPRAGGGPPAPVRAIRVQVAGLPRANRRPQEPQGAAEVGGAHRRADDVVGRHVVDEMGTTPQGHASPHREVGRHRQRSHEKIARARRPDGAAELARTVPADTINSDASSSVDHEGPACRSVSSTIRLTASEW